MRRANSTRGAVCRHPTLRQWDVIRARLISHAGAGVGYVWRPDYDPDQWDIVSLPTHEVQVAAITGRTLMAACQDPLWVRTRR